MRGGFCSSRLRPHPSGQGSSSSPGGRGCRDLWESQGLPGAHGRPPAGPGRLACALRLARGSRPRCLMEDRARFLTSVLLVLGGNEEIKASLLSCRKADAACCSGFCFYEVKKTSSYKTFVYSSTVQGKSILCRRWWLWSALGIQRNKTPKNQEQGLGPTSAPHVPSSTLHSRPEAGGAPASASRWRRTQRVNTRWAVTRP